MGEGLRLLLLGKPQILRDGVPVTGFVYNKALALLAYLAVTKRPHSRESLAGLLWGEMPDAAAMANLRKILSVLREIAAPNVEIGRQAVSFNRDSNYWLDTEIFESKPQDPTATSITPAEMQDRDVKLLDDAVQLYKGDFLEGFYVRDAPAFEEWVLPERERLRQRMLQALYRLAAYYTDRGDYARGIEYTTRLLTLEPWHEEVHQQMMLLLALSGQRSSALNQFEVCRRLLAEELGVQPNRDTVDLHHRIARGEVTSQPTLARLPRDWPVRSHPLRGTGGGAGTTACLSRGSGQPLGNSGWHQRGGQDTPGPAGGCSGDGGLSAECTFYTGSRSIHSRGTRSRYHACARFAPDRSAQCGCPVDQPFAES